MCVKDTHEIQEEVSQPRGVVAWECQFALTSEAAYVL
jgi:hypothetical protein